jgi:type IV pilus assembly protein PilE
MRISNMPLKHQQGVTLIELMIAVAVVAILAGVAYPAYRDTVMKSSRTDGKARLMKVAEDLEKCFTRFNAYNSASCGVVDTATAIDPVFSENGKYRITGALTATTFDLTATPQGAQASDTKCGNLTLDETNARGKTGSAPLSECW